MKKAEIIRGAAFFILCLALLLAAALVFDRKTACDYAVRVNGFYNEPEDSFDILFYGSSHMYCTISPLELWQETGLRSYVLATQQQPLAATYYYMKDSLETQSPKLLVLELYSADMPLERAEEGTLRDCIDPLPWSKNKVEMIKRLIPEGERASYYFNFLKYHGRWKELSARDFDFTYLKARDAYRGYIYFSPQREAKCAQLDLDAVEAVPLPEENLEILRQIMSLAEENGAELLFLIAPYEAAAQDAGSIKSMHLFAQENSLSLLDFNTVYNAVGFDGQKDFFDAGHLNAYGAGKATAYLGQFIRQQYGLEASPSAADSQWQADYNGTYGAR